MYGRERGSYETGLPLVTVYPRLLYRLEWIFSQNHGNHLILVYTPGWVPRPLVIISGQILNEIEFWSFETVQGWFTRTSVGRLDFGMGTVW